MNNTGEILIYQNDQGNTQLEVILEDETVWLTQTQMSELFGKAVSTINEHIKNIYTEKELPEEGTLRTFGIPNFLPNQPILNIENSKKR